MKIDFSKIQGEKIKGEVVKEALIQGLAINNCEWDNPKAFLIRDGNVIRDERGITYPIESFDPKDGLWRAINLELEELMEWIDRKEISKDFVGKLFKDIIQVGNSYVGYNDKVRIVEGLSKIKIV